MAKPIVAIVGRQNVGKSALFNRIIGQRLAIVEDLPGTTRDRLYADAEWQGKTFALVDTGGLVLGGEDDLLASVRLQAEQAIAEADAVILVTDVVSGLTATDQELADILRRTSKPILLCANKADTAQRRLDAAEFYSLGLGEVYPTSALHGTGVAERRANTPGLRTWHLGSRGAKSDATVVPPSEGDEARRDGRQKVLAPS